MIYILISLGILVLIAGFLAFRFYQSNKDLKQKLLILNQSLDLKTSQMSAVELELDSIKRENIALIEKKARLEGDIEREKKNNEQMLHAIKEINENAKNEFKVLSQSILDERIKAHKESTEENLNNILKPLKTQLETLKTHISEIHTSDSKDRNNLIGELKILKELNSKMSQEAANLASALKGSNKAQGNWGEMILEKLLQDSGLTKGREYSTQETFTSDDGNLRPDVIINLPNNKKIIIDSKVSLLDYEKFCSKNQFSEDDLQRHILSLRTHIKGLSKKNYENILNIQNLDFVLMFIPVEGAFLDALRYDNDLFNFAYNQNIVLVSPTTLLATLRTIGNIWRNEKQNSSTQDILNTAIGLYDKFYAFFETLESIGKNIDSLKTSYQKSLNQLKDGKGSIYSRIEKLESLGLKTSKKLSEK